MRFGKLNKKNKKLFSSLVFFGVIFSFSFLFGVDHADAFLGLDWIGDKAGDAFFYVINIVLYSVFVLVSYPVTWSAMIFGLTVDPVAVNTMFKMDVIYTLWQMIRDFFNLFFILTLLFIAFATIFQIDSFNYKKTLGKLLLMALLVNFSFPVTRFIIDTANVPMYFFMESIFSDKTQAKAENVTARFLGVSKITELILGKADFGVSDIQGDKDITTKLLVGIIFMFLFGVSLFVLALMFLVRSIMLVLLIIFSPVGFVGKVVPGFSKYASEWWDALLRYAFFGPAAMLMLLVSLKFLEGFTGAGGMGGPAAIAGQSSVAPGNTYLASMVAIMAPLIMIWMSITVGQKMGIHGANEVTGRAQKFSKWAGRKASGYDATARRVKAFGSEMKKRSDAKFAATNIGTRFGQKAGLKMDEMSAKRVGTRFESRGARHDASAAEESQKRQIAAEAANHRINDRTSQSELKKQADEAYNAKDRAWLMAVQNQQAKKKETAEDIKDEHKDFVNENYKDIGEVENAARKENNDALSPHRADLVYRSDAEREKALNEGKIKLDQQSSRSLNTLAAAAVKTGKVNQEMLEAMKKEDPAKAASFLTAVDAGIKAMEKEYARVESSGSTLTEEQQKARATSHQAYYHATGNMHGTVMGNNAHHAAVRGRVFKKANPTTLKANLKNPTTRDADVENIVRSTPTGQIVSTTATLVDEDEAAARAFVANIRSQQTHSDPVIRANADSAMKMLANDRRTQHLVTP